MPPSQWLSSSHVQEKLPDGATDHRVPKAVREAQIEIDRLIAELADDRPFVGTKPPALGNIEYETCQSGLEGSAPVHLIISSRQALTKRFGRIGYEGLNTDLRHLKEAIGQRGDLDAVILYVDDETSVTRFGLQPADPTNPWQVKKLVDSLDARLMEQEREIRYLLIVGGDGVIPFHRLPNPVDDQDSDVPSDNPYASRDDNYLIPERAVGRMPAGEIEGVEFLRALIRTSVEAHQKRAVSKGLLGTLTATLRTGKRLQVNGHGLGYSASIWRKASRAVFRVIGDDDRLRTCPPLTYADFQVVEPPHLSYFNLHGIEDGPNWYGQRDVLFPADYPLFPLALRPQDQSIKEHKDAVVFTEACYGANILGKREVDSIALRLLRVGALAVIGSTKVSYGAIAPPLLGADLMGKYFWEGLRAHLTVGQALRHAKVSLASEMQERQGYLDNEDQKALISFVLYGDPSLPISSIQGGTVTGVRQDVFCPPIICSRRTEIHKSIVSDELVAGVKARIEMSLPHMSQARMRAKPLMLCTGSCRGNCGTPAANKTPASASTFAVQKDLARKDRGWALTLHKDIAIQDDGAHHQTVRVVVDESGRILRMAVSK